MILRGGVHWVDLGAPRGSQPPKRPVVIVQADAFNVSRVSTVIAVVVTSNTSLASLPGNVFLPSSATGLPRDCVVNVTGFVTVDKDDLGDPVGRLPAYLVEELHRGLRRVLAL